MNTYRATLCSRLVHDFPGFTPSGNQGKERVEIGQGAMEKFTITRRVPLPELLFQVLPLIEELAASTCNASGRPLPVDPVGVERIAPS
jgi:hypothetical protein